MNYQGDFLEDATVYIPFNTFDSNDPSASVTITDLAQGDVEIWKDGVVQTTPGAGVTLTLNIGDNNGTHLIAVDTSDTTDAGFYAINADYLARINGTTVDGATVNAWVGGWSTENRFKEVTVTSMAADVITAAAIAAAAIDNATFAADVGSTAHGDNIIALAVRKILEELNLDHLLKITTSVAADGDLEDYVVAGTVMAHVMAAAADATAFKASTDSLEAIKVHADTIKAETALIVADTNELQTDDYPASIAAIKAETALIVADTNELQTDDYPTSIAAIKAETVLIVEDTNEIQGKLPTNKFMGSSDGADDDGTLNSILEDSGTTLENRQVTIAADAARLTAVRAAILTDWIDGGRLDLLLDAIKVVTDNLADAATTMISGTVSHDVTAASSTIFYSDDITEATADHFNGRIVIFLDGDLQYQATDITDYALVTGEGKFTVTELTEAPADNVTFVIV